MKLKFALLLATTPLAACSSLGGGGGEYGYSSYGIVGVKRVAVGTDKMSVAVPRPWNRHRAALFSDVPETEDWTLNGPILDQMSFVTGLKSGRYLIEQSKRADNQVPKFRDDMTPPEIAAMLETLFRVKGGAVEFETLSLQPRQFLGVNGFQFDFEHLDTDELRRKGRAVGAVVDGRLYLILFDAAKSHYYPDALPDFEAAVTSARLRAS